MQFKKRAAGISGYTESHAAFLARNAGLGERSTDEEIRAFFRRYTEEAERLHGCSKIMVEIDGESRSLSSWCRMIGCRYETVRHRVNALTKRDSSIDKHVARTLILRQMRDGTYIPISRGGFKRPPSAGPNYTIDGVTRSTQEWAMIVGMEKRDLLNMISKGRKKGRDPVEIITRYLARRTEKET